MTAGCGRGQACECQSVSWVVGAASDAGTGQPHLSISALITSMTSSGRREMFLWPRSMVIPGCCCCNSRGADSAAARMSLRECSNAAFVNSTTWASEMGGGASLLMMAETNREDLAIRRPMELRTCCSRAGRGQVV
jgi:hypothetical protein